MKTAVIHDWLIKPGGGENVLEEILEIFPSPVYTLVYNKERMGNSKICKHPISTSFIQKLPKSRTSHQLYLPLFSYAIEQFDLSEYDLILSSSHCVAKGVLTTNDQLHICYCNTPVRYAWDLYHQYMEEANLNKGLKGLFVKRVLHNLRMWDLNSSFRVDHFIGNSQYIAKRINKIYRREAEVIYPPVDVEYFSFYPNKDNFYVTASRLVPYKKIDLIVEAFASMPDKKLVVIGDGSEMKKIKDKAASNIEILGHISRDKMKELFQRAKAFIFAAVEDFGIVPVEAQSCGTPVIAYNQGGVRETVIQNKTGIFFDSQDVESIKNAVKEFESREDSFVLKDIADHAQKFSYDRFRKEYSSFVNQKYQEFCAKEKT